MMVILDGSTLPSDLIEEILLEPSFEDDFEIERDVESIDDESDD